MSGQVLIERLEPSVAKVVTESSPDGKHAFLQGIFMMADIENRNKRRYPLSEISRAVDDAQKVISERNGIMGELDHPQTLTINLDRVSHVITELYMQGQNACGKAKLLETPMGNIARELIRNDVALGLSSRGAGNVGTNGMVSEFQFVTEDIVAQPSAPDAYPQPVYESILRNSNGENILDLAEAVRHDTAAQKYFKKQILKFLSEDLFAKKK